VAGDPAFHIRFLSFPFKSVGAGGLPLSICTIPAEGGPSLRFLQGWVAMLRVLFDLLWTRDQTHLPPAFPTPALRNKREERGTHYVGNARKIKSLGHPPINA
jgi:hypothetical protein